MAVPCTPGAGTLLPPQLLFHPTGNKEVAEPCLGSTAGESPGPAVAGTSAAGEETLLGCWQGAGSGCMVVGVGPHSTVGLGRRG